MQVSEIMSKSVVSVSMDDTLKVVKDIFEKASFHHLLVVESNKLCGVISDRDLLKAISHNLGTASETTKDIATLNKRAHQIISRQLITLPPTAGVYDAISLFNNHKISCIPIVNEAGKPVGLLSWRDIFKTIENRKNNKTN
ncbi:CBS domain-containing protein [Thalassotalea profundi]|uniref:CBS domain-containing protein n=1 Tax=Thalassotalea profundi TaxID=2036687 RepID=A0ABQ3IMR4_9GAMM|nr:CBS domain-containing protein [Thalassotalea profundi]GHE88879.1 CBS domain-containing protein [Thalassotalea profundi]